MSRHTPNMKKMSLLCVVLFLAVPAFSQPRELTPAGALRLAEKFSPELKAALAQEKQAAEAVEMLKSYYYPNLVAEGQKGYGSPAEKRTGVMGQPYAINPTGGISSKITLIDLTRDYSLKSARQKLRSAQEQVRIIRYKLYQNALQLYFNAVRSKGQAEAWQDMAEEIDKVYKKVEIFTKTGQHSMVERLLVQDQAIDAAMTKATYDERYNSALRQLATATGTDEKEISCPSPAAVAEKYLEDFDTSGTSPAVAKAESELEAARTGIFVSSSERIPKVQTLANMGSYEQSKSGGASMNYYSANISLVLPLFEGFRVSNAIKRAKAFAEEKENDLAAARLDLRQSNTRLDETINTSKLRLQYLGKGTGVAKDGLEQAKIRYLSFEGPLNEVREAIRNLARVKTQTNDANVDLLQALGSKAVINGAALRSSAP